MTLSDAHRRLLIDYFCARSVNALYLFGSQARGDATAGSDIDLVLDCATGATAPLNLAACKRALEPILGRRLDIYLQHRLPRYVQRSILHERVVLFDIRQRPSDCGGAAG